MATDRLSDAEVERRMAEARRLRDAQRSGPSVLEAIAPPSFLDAFLSGALNGIAFNWGDELGDVAGLPVDFETANEAHPGAYALGNFGGVIASPLTRVISRLPIQRGERLYNEARDVLSRNGVAQREIARGNGDFAAPLPYLPEAADIAAVARRDPAAAARLRDDRANALAQTEELLALRRGFLDDYSGVDAAAHGALIGSGGLEPGDTSIEERATGGVLGALGALALTRASGEIKDLSGIPVRGARWSAQDVVDLPGPRNQPADVDAFFNRARMFDEAAFRDRTGDTFFARAAGPSPTMRAEPQVAPLDDQNPLIRAALARAQQSPAGQQILGRLADGIDVRRALESYGGMTPKGPAPTDPATLPAHIARDYPVALREDAMVRPDALRTVVGDREFFDAAKVAPELRSKRQLDDAKRGRVDKGQYPGLNPTQRNELAHAVARDAFEQASALAKLPRGQQAQAARKLLKTLDDPHFKRLMTAMQLREGKTSVLTKELASLRSSLDRIAQSGAAASADDITRQMQRGKGRGADPVIAEAARQLANYPMSRRMAEALLDEPSLRRPRDAHWVNPADRGEDALLQVRRESVKPPWPYRSPPGQTTQVAGDVLALGLDHAQHAALSDFWDRLAAR